MRMRIVAGVVKHMSLEAEVREGTPVAAHIVVVESCKTAVAIVAAHRDGVTHTSAVAVVEVAAGRAEVMRSDEEELEGLVDRVISNLATKVVAEVERMRQDMGLMQNCSATVLKRTCSW